MAVSKARRAPWSAAARSARGVLSGAALLTAAGMGIASVSQTPDGIIAAGVHAAGMDWSGLTQAAAKEQLGAWADEERARRLPLRIAPEANVQKTWTPRLGDLGAAVDADATVAEAMAVGRRDGLVAALIARFAGREEVHISPKWVLDEKKARTYLYTQVAPSARRTKADARYILVAGRGKVVPEQVGAALDLVEATGAVAARIVTGSREPLALPLKVVSPRIITADLQAITGEVARFRTRYTERGNREANVKASCERINGHVVMPGEVFSYNQVVGPRDAERGYRMAKVIVRGRVEQGVGGGICQTSTTLYNAALLADLDIVSRSHHAFPVPYCKPGTDATVVYGQIDFRFRNTTDAPIAISAAAGSGQVNVHLFGKPVAGKTVRIERTNISTWRQGTMTVSDPSIAPGKTKRIDKGHAGWRGSVWRVVMQNGKQVRRERISSDVYAAVPAIVAAAPTVPPGAGAGSAPTAPNPKPLPSPITPASIRTQDPP